MKKNVFCIEHHKGGIGKTTSTFNVAAALAKLGYKVLEIDADPQASLTLSAGYSPEDFPVTICEVLDGAAEISEAIYKVEGIENLSLVPSKNSLAEIQDALYGKKARERKLKKVVDQIKGNFDYVLIDCPPQLTLLVINCIYAADYVIVPCETSRLAFYNLEEFAKTVQGINEELEKPEPVEILGIFATMYDARVNTDREVLAALKEQMDYPFLGCIARAAAAKRGLEKGLPAVINEPKESLSKAYMEITKKIVELIEAERKEG